MKAEDTPPHGPHLQLNTPLHGPHLRLTPSAPVVSRAVSVCVCGSAGAVRDPLLHAPLVVLPGQHILLQPLHRRLHRTSRPTALSRVTAATPITVT